MIYSNKITRLFRIIQVSFLVLLFFTGCQQSHNKESYPDINIRSFFDEYPNANKIAKKWDSEAELVHVHTVHYVIVEELYENSITFRFEVFGNLDHYLEIKCFDDQCTRRIIPSEGFSFLGRGLSPISIEEVKIDSTEALGIAIANDEFHFAGETVRFSTVLVRDLDTDELEWHITNSTFTYNDRSCCFSNVVLDPFTGEVLEIYER